MKCGFFDCNNKTEKGQNSCQSCESGKREEWKICSACRQKLGEKEYSSHHDTLLINNFVYYMGAKMQDKAPSQFQAEFDPILSDLKLSESEKKLIRQAEKMILDFLAEKGGKQDNSNWFNICLACTPELEERQEEFLKQHPEFKSLMERIEKSQEKMQTISKKIGQAIGKEKWDEISKKAMEELTEEIGDNWRDENYNGPTGPGDKGPNNDNGNGPNKPNQRDNDNSAQINQLQQEINGLRQEVEDLKKPNNPSPPNPTILQEKEQKIKDKEKELEKLKTDDNSPSTNQPSKNGNSNLLLYLGLGVMGIVIIALVILLILAKKKKKLS